MAVRQMHAEAPRSTWEVLEYVKVEKTPVETTAAREVPLMMRCGIDLKVVGWCGAS